MISEYKSTGLYNILSGTYTPADTASDAASADNSTVIDTLNKNHNKFGRFSLNPVNNPEFKVVGSEGLSKDGTDFTKPTHTFSNKSNISLKVAMGLDSIPVVKESLKIYLLPCIR